MNLPVKIAANTLVQILGRIISSGIGLLIIILLARNFGLTGFGDFIKITTFITLFYLIADFGFNAVFLRDLTNKDFSKLLGTRIFFATLLILVAAIIPFFLPFNESQNLGFTPFVRAGILIYSLTILTQAVFTTSNVIFQKKLRYDLSVFASSSGQLAMLILVFTLLILKSSLFLILAALLAGNILMVFLSLFLLRKEVTSIWPSFNWQFVKKITVTTLPLGVTLVFNLIYFRADSFLLTLLRPTQEVGIYGLAFKFFELPLAIPTFFGNAIYPVLLKNKNGKNFRKIIFLSSVILLSTSLGLLLILWLGAPLIAFIQKDFALSIFPFRILILSLPLFFLSSLYQWGLIAINRQKLLAQIYFFSMILNIVLNLLFIPKYSYFAASVITGISEGIVFLLTLIFIIKSLKRSKSEMA